MLPLALKFSKPTIQLLLLYHVGSHIHRLANGVPSQHSPILPTLPMTLSLVAMTANGRCHIFFVCIYQPKKHIGPCPKPTSPCLWFFQKKKTSIPMQPINGLQYHTPKNPRAQWPPSEDEHPPVLIRQNKTQLLHLRLKSYNPIVRPNPPPLGVRSPSNGLGLICLLGISIVCGWVFG
jgi:hypothetical protein